MVVNRDISIVKTIRTQSDFCDRIMGRNSVSMRRLKSLPLIYVLKPQALPDHTQDTIEQQNIFNSYSKHQNTYKTNSVIQACNIIKNICTLNQPIKSLMTNNEELSVNDFINQLAYETKRSYRLSENFRQLLFRHFEGYENVYFGGTTEDQKRSVFYNIDKHDSYTSKIVLKNRIKHHNDFNYNLLNNFLEKREHLYHLEKVTKVLQLMPYGIDYEKRIQVFNHIMNSPMIYSAQKVQAINYDTIHSYDINHIEFMNHKKTYEQMTSIRQTSVNGLNRYLTMLNPNVYTRLENIMNLSTNLYRTISMFNQFDESTSASWILNTLSKTRRKSSKFNQQYENLFLKSETPKSYNMITYNNIVQEKNQVSKNLSMVNEMISFHTRRRENDLKNNKIRLNVKTAENTVNSEKLNPFHSNQKKNQNRIVTNLLGMISNEMSKNIVVRNMMNQLFVNTETVTDMKKSDLKYNKWFNTIRKNAQSELISNRQSETLSHIELQYRQENKTTERNEIEIQTRRTEQINSKDYIKKNELLIEPTMLTEGTIKYLGHRLIETIETKQRRDYERRGR